MPPPRPTVPLSVLDLSPIPAGGTATEALRHTLDLAQAAEALGYRRYWVAEHHASPGVASSSTPVLVALLAAATSAIRVGSGAVLLPGTPPLQVAEQFGTVAAVHPGRVDLGLGRSMIAAVLESLGRPQGPRPAPPPSRVVDGLLLPAPGRMAGDPALIRAIGGLLGLAPGGPDYRTQVSAVLDHLAGRTRGPGGDPLPVPPATGADLDVWVLGSSPGESAQTAAAFGLPFAASYHVTPSSVLDTVAAYRAAFRPGVLARPHVMVSADVVVAATDAAARRLAAPYAEWVLGIRSGRGALPYVTPEQARARTWTDAERAMVADRVDTQFVGAPGTVVERLATLTRVTGADELMVTTITTDLADRVRSTELLAHAWGQQAAAA